MGEGTLAAHDAKFPCRINSAVPFRKLMADVTLEQVFEEAKALTPDEQRQLRELLAREQMRGRRDEIKPVGHVPVIDRGREMRWLIEHRDEYAGQWVALAGDRLIAHGSAAREVFAAARAAGVERPLVAQVEPKDALPFGGW